MTMPTPTTAATNSMKPACADAEAAPDPEAAADYARRYANWRLLTDKLGEWVRSCGV